MRTSAPYHVDYITATGDVQIGIVFFLFLFFCHIQNLNDASTQNCLLIVSYYDTFPANVLILQHFLYISVVKVIAVELHTQFVFVLNCCPA